MIRTTNENIAYHWRKNEAAVNSTQCYTTDGRDLYSYALKIGTTNEQGEKILFDYTANGIKYYSQTTSCHVGKSRQYADWIQVNEVELKANKALYV
jgi:hypothetical protein